MREIKFRAWDSYLGFYVDWKSYFIRNGKVYFDNDGDIIDQTEKLILEQYTGLKDKNGKEIYEGDILRWIKHDGTEYANYIYWCEGTAYHGWKIKNGRYHKALSPNGIYNANAEIIGNIHEN